MLKRNRPSLRERERERERGFELGTHGESW